MLLSTLSSLEKKLPDLPVRHFCDHVYAKNTFLLHQTSQLSRPTAETDIILLCSQVQHPIRWPQALVIRKKTRPRLEHCNKLQNLKENDYNAANMMTMMMMSHQLDFGALEYLKFCGKRTFQYKDPSLEHHFFISNR